MQIHLLHTSPPPSQAKVKVEAEAIHLKTYRKNNYRETEIFVHKRAEKQMRSHELMCEATQNVK